MTITELNKSVKEITCCMMTTIGKNGRFNSRPMFTIFDKEDSLEYFYFFCMKESDKILELVDNQNISLDFQRLDIGSIHVAGQAEIIDNIAQMEQKWDDKLTKFWVDGLHTPGVTMIKVTTQEVRYWIAGEGGCIEY